MTIRAHAKVNIFLKIVGTRGSYHLLSSRFMQVADLFDTITFQPQQEGKVPFKLDGDFGCSVEQNSIYKAYRLLLETTDRERVETFFENHEVVVEKRIPEFAGLGGGSSDAAAFLRLTNEVCRLGLTVERLAEIGAQIGADVPFFVYDYPSANVSGIGEIVVPFEEEALPLRTFTPDIRCDTAAIYRKFRESFIQQIDANARSAEKMEHMRSDTLLQTFDTEALNDLYAPALAVAPQLAAYAKEGWFFSGSGSTFFSIGEN